MGYLDELMQRAKSKGEVPSVPSPQKEERESQPEKIMLESYGDVKVYRVPGDPVLLYEVAVPRYRGEEKALIDLILDIASRTVSVNEALFQTKLEKRRKYFKQVMEIIEATPELKAPLNAKEFYANAVVREITGFGFIDPLIADDALEEIMVIGANKPVFVFHRKHQMMRTNIMVYDDKLTRDIIDRIARNVGRRIDIQSPLLDARLADGTRVNATIPPISLDGSTLTLRKFRRDPMSIIDLLNMGTLNAEVAAFLWTVVEGLGAMPANTLIGGGTASGKTTTLNAMMSFAPNYERTISIEDTAEIQLPFEHWVRFEVRPPGIEGSGEIDANALLKNALRMRPDRIIIGEIRGDEGYTMFSAMNTGHRGVMGTLHSNSARETLIRLTSPPMSVPLVMLSALNFVVMQQRIYDRRKGLIRRLSEVAEVIPGDEGKLPEMQILYSWNPASDVIERTGVESSFVQVLAKYTGSNREGVWKEVERRKEFLKGLQAKGIRDLDSVNALTQDYVVKSQGRG